MKRVVAGLALLTFSSSVCYSADSKFFDTQRSERGEAEYYNANKDRRLENRVNFVSGVQTPGIYHFPDTVNLVEAISLAGGAEKDADLSKVYVKRYSKDGFVTYKYNLSDMMDNKEMVFPPLADRDTVMLEPNHSTQNTLLGLNILTTILGIALTSALLIQVSKK
jgi:hypothetical protein